VRQAGNEYPLNSSTAYAEITDFAYTPQQVITNS